MSGDGLEEIDGGDDSEKPGYFTTQGYAWYAYPAGEDAPSAPHEFGPGAAIWRNLGYSGSLGEVTGLLNRWHDGAYLIVTHDETAPRVLNGWEVEPAELDHDFENKCLGVFRLVRKLKQRDPDIEPFQRYEFEGWD